MADTPAGWYPDPENPGQLRYWDGEQWTEHRSAQTASTPPPQQQWQSSGYGPPAQRVDPWLWQSIVVTVLSLICCLPLPFGVVGIVMASQSNTAMSSGDHATAVAKARQAKIWTLVALGIAILMVVGYIMLVAIAGFSIQEMQFQEF
jgi:hypothetical protein